MRKKCLLWISLVWALGVSAQDAHEELGSISGTVLDISGNPYPAQVRVFRKTIREGFASWDSMCGTNTGEQGGFECPNLAEGKYIVQVLPLRTPKKQIGKTKEIIAKTTPASVFYPGVTDLQQAITISLRSKETGWADVRVTDAPAVEVTGTLFVAARNVYARLKAEAADGLTLDTGIKPRYDSSTGRVVVPDVPPGHYQLVVNWLGKGLERPAASSSESNSALENSSGEQAASELRNAVFRSATLRFVVDGSPTNPLLVEAAPLIDISGQIPDLPDGVTVSGMRLMSTDGVTRDRGAIMKNGSFIFRSIPEGEYNLSLLPSQSIYVDSVSTGGKSVGNSRFSVAAGQDMVHLDLDVKGPGVSIQGSVKEWGGQAGSADVVAQFEDTGELYKVKTDKERKFSFAGLKPGDYRFFAWPGSDTVEYRNPLVLQKYYNDCTEISVGQDSIGNAIELSPIEKEH